jgi:hypothetical protein
VKRFGIMLVAVLAAISPLHALAQEAPVPLPRRADRLPEASATVDGAVATPTPETAEDSSDETAALVEISVPASAALDAAESVAAAGPPQPVTLVARITDEGGPIPSGVVWRVFETRTDANGELALAAKSADATAHLELPPGQYVVHVAYGRAQTTDTMTVADGENSKSLVLDAGAIRLNAAVTGDVPIPINLLSFDVYTSGTDTERTLVAEKLSPNALVTLNAGTYHVVSNFGSVNAVVRADLRVEPGQLTEATLYHKAAQVSFKLVSEPGGEAIADIDWTVKTSDGQSVFTNTGAFPSTVLAEGDYLVLAKRGDQVFNREFEVQAGPAREIEVLTTVY